MASQVHRLRALLAALGLGAALVPTAAAELWQWTDAQGVVRYTPDPGRVPSGARGTMLKVEPGMALPAPLPAPAPSGAAVIYAPPDEDLFEADPFNAPERQRRIEGTDVPEAAPPPSQASAPAPSQASAPSPAPQPQPDPYEGTAPMIRVPDQPQQTATVATPPPEPARPPSPEVLARRAELRTLIEQDQEALKELISRPAGDVPLEQSPEFLEIARRLPVLQAELRALEEGKGLAEPAAEEP